MTTSLANFLSSLIFGGTVLGVIGIALVVVSRTDRLTRS
jgi:hypothetical protein